jgi:hypothetical protein
MQYSENKVWSVCGMYRCDERHIILIIKAGVIGVEPIRAGIIENNNVAFYSRIQVFNNSIIVSLART